MNENARPARRTIPPGVLETRWSASDGQAIRRIDWPLRVGASGSILFLPGRGDSYEKYLETLDHWHRLGWNVTASDWRGQGDSGRLGADAVTGHIADFAMWIEDLATLWRQWSATRPGPHILAAHSMGGHLVLRAMAEHLVEPSGAILSAPMLGLTGRRLPDWLMHALARAMASLGDPRRPAWKWNEQPGAMPDSRIRLLTHDAGRYADELWWREARPELVMGPGS
jgi:lysophospholipase